jgi:hypothetical protein
LWSAGTALFGSIPSAHVADITPEPRRAKVEIFAYVDVCLYSFFQALALLRISGDIGMLVGATLAGTIANVTDKGFAMQVLLIQ